MSLPRRIRLVKLLRAHGLRDVERMREDELKEVLGRLRTAEMSAGEGHRSPESDGTDAPPSSSALVARSTEPPPVVDDSDDPWALPRFREPKVLVPEGQRTFVRAIAVKPRLLFCTWDMNLEERDLLEGPVELQVFWSEFLGDAPSVTDVLRGPAMLRMPVEVASAGWYVTVPGDRLAMAVALVVSSTGRRIVASNLTLAPPARPASPGPHWEATLPPSLDRRRLRDRGLFTGSVVPLRRVGETDARAVTVTVDEGRLESDVVEPEELEPELPASGSLVRSPRLQIRQARAGAPSSGALAKGGARPPAPAGKSTPEGKR